MPSSRKRFGSRHCWPGTAVACALALVACSSKLPVGTAVGAQRPPSIAAGDQALSGLGGVVLLNGQPAAGVSVHVTRLASAVLSSNGAAIHSVGAGPLFSDQGAGLHLTEASTEVKTDANGRFQLQVPASEAFNLEAAQAVGVKAIRQALHAADGDVSLQLRPTGGLSGRVTAPGKPGVTDFEGVDVFIPGTGYAAKTDARGAFTLDHVPTGDFVLVASKAGLGRGSLGGVHVAPGGTTQLPALALATSAAVVTAIVPAIAAPGLPLEIQGEGFGASTGTPFQVTLGGRVMSAPERVSDHVLRLSLPPDATSGDLVVAVGGVPGAPVHAAVAHALVAAPGRDALLRAETYTLEALALDADSTPLGPVAGSWQVSGDGARLASGSLVTGTSGAVHATCTFGTLSDSVQLPVRAAIGLSSRLYGDAAANPSALAWDPHAHRLLAIDAGGEGTPARLLALDENGAVTPLPFDAAGQAPREVAAGSDGAVYVLTADNAIWRQDGGGAARRVFDPAALAGLFASLPAPTGGPPADGPATPGGGPAPVPSSRGLLVDAAGRLVFQSLPGLAVRVKPDQGAEALPFAPAGVPGVGALPNLLAAGPLGLMAYLPRPNLLPALELVPDSGRPTPVTLSADPGAAGGLAIDGQSRLYLAGTDRRAIYQLDAQGTLSTLVGDASATATEHRGPSAPRALAVDAEGATLWVLDGARPPVIQRITLRRAALP